MTAIVDEVEVPGHDRPAYVVRPDGPPPPGGWAGVVWLHWLGDERSDRSQFLTEAVELAALGCVSVLPDGHFPWRVAPNGTAADREAVQDQLHRLAAAARLLTAYDVDADRTGIVGHDYGAMYTLGAGGLGARAVVAITPDETWHHWFLRHWPHGTPEPGYATSFDDVDPVRGAQRCQDRLLLQWAQHDEYVRPQVAQAYAAAAPEAWSVSYRGRDHRVGDVAVRERRAFLVARLGLAERAEAR